MVLAQVLFLSLGFHAFGNHLELEVVPEVHNRDTDRSGAGVDGDVAHKGLVNLQVVHRQAFQVAQR